MDSTATTGVKREAGIPWTSSHGFLASALLRQDASLLWLASLKFESLDATVRQGAGNPLLSA